VLRSVFKTLRICTGMKRTQNTRFEFSLRWSITIGLLRIKSANPFHEDGGSEFFLCIQSTIVYGVITRSTTLWRLERVDFTIGGRYWTWNRCYSNCHKAACGEESNAVAMETGHYVIGQYLAVLSPHSMQKIVSSIAPISAIDLCP
jgi:hypothetical protein